MAYSIYGPTSCRQKIELGILGLSAIKPRCSVYLHPCVTAPSKPTPSKTPSKKVAKNATPSKNRLKIGFPKQNNSKSYPKKNIPKTPSKYHLLFFPKQLLCRPQAIFQFFFFARPTLKNCDCLKLIKTGKFKNFSNHGG